ncbi:periodic tryptophan protein [Perkinsela sp. CCAP 1560/4]|nr:periodic tryptophan protein [Perkinsela sp. CCAP 1560/4]|eukprot:KNH03959.1 periodic tryptophan protein [Perkinsela sp. CCAP 1560/4]
MLRTEYELDRIVGGGFASGNIALHEDIENKSFNLLSATGNRIATHDLGTLRKDTDGTSLLPGAGGSTVSSWSSYQNIVCFDVTPGAALEGTTPSDQMIVVVDEKGFGLFANLTKDISLETVMFHPTTCVVRFSHPWTSDASESSKPAYASNVLAQDKPHVPSGTIAQYYLAVGTQLGEVSIYSTPLDGMLKYRSIRLLNRYRAVFSRSACTSIRWIGGNDYVLASGGDGTARLLPRNKIFEDSTEEQTEGSAPKGGRKLIATFAAQRGAVVGAYFVYTQEKCPAVLLVTDCRVAALWSINSLLQKSEVEKWKHDARKLHPLEQQQLTDELKAIDATAENELVQHYWDRKWKGSLRSKAMADDTVEEVLHGKVFSSAFSDEGKILVVGLSTGALAIFRLDMGFFNDSMNVATDSPLTCLHVVSISCHPLSSLEVSANGNLIALGIPNAQSLMVYDWRRELFVFTRQGHMSTRDGFGSSMRNMISSLAYTSDGKFLLTGGNDGRIKVWDAESGKCMHTFLGSALKTPSDKLSENTEREFTPYIAARVVSIIGGSNSNAFFSLTSDGVIRGYDIAKARCFRIFQVREEVLVAEPLEGNPMGEDAAEPQRPKLVPKIISVTPTFSCMALDHSEEVLVAATDFIANSLDPVANAQSSYYIYVFSTQTGAVMEFLSSGHTAPITAINFHPSGVFFATTSWDASVIVWKVFGSKEDGDGYSFAPNGFGRAYEKNRLRPVIIERISLNTECLSVEFADDGRKMAVLTRDGEVHVIACERVTNVGFNTDDEVSPSTTAPAVIEPWEIITSWNVRRDAEGGWIQRSKETSMVPTMTENRKNYYSSGNVNPIVRRDSHIAHFDCMRFTPSSVGLLLAGKNSRWIVFYHVIAGSGTTGTGGGVLLRKWNVSSNRSIAGNIELYPWRTRRGSAIAALGSREDPDDFLPNVDYLEEDRERQWIGHAGKRPDRGSGSGERYASKFHTQIHNRQEREDENIGVHTLLFSRGGDEWAAATSTGVLIFALQSTRALRRTTVDRGTFRPLGTITSEFSVDGVNRILGSLAQTDLAEDSYERAAMHVRSITMTLSLRLPALSRCAVLCVPTCAIRAVAAQVPVNVLTELLEALTCALRDAFQGASSISAEMKAFAHISADAPECVEQILLWVRTVLVLHGQLIHSRPRFAAVTGVTINNRIHQLARLLSDFESLARVVEENTNMLRFLCETPDASEECTVVCD